MKVFSCGTCGQQLFFENTFCFGCQSTLGFYPDRLEVAALEETSGAWRMCRNYEVEGVCNWLVPADDPNPFCVSCRLNQTIPELSLPGNRRLWAKMEAAKRRLVYSLLRLGLPVVPKSADFQIGLAFEFLSNTVGGVLIPQKVITGHRGGVITIDLIEADDAARERIRQNIGEEYRTLLGHFRHEVGHYYWDRLVAWSPHLDEVRQLFGDEREDYSTSLGGYYARGAPPDWSSRFVTAYASSHPWEDWAETWAHYLHIMDTLETAAENGLALVRPAGTLCIADPFQSTFAEIRESWHELRMVMNSLNRSMGMPDPYPFVLSDSTAEKLGFIHRLVNDRCD